MKIKKCKVIEEYKTPYTEPLIFNEGETVEIGKKESEWEGWIWCTNKSCESRWIPKNYLEISGKKGKLNRNYEATELSVKKGEVLQIEDEEAQWFWVKNENGSRGWVPIKNVKIIKS
ncbi:MAG: SH3 domain-containing protein [Candidatus Lokiarchaeota archaeon]